MIEIQINEIAIYNIENVNFSFVFRYVVFAYKILYCHAHLA